MSEKLHKDYCEIEGIKMQIEEMERKKSALVNEILEKSSEADEMQNQINDLYKKLGSFYKME